jgi:hypothetical protein
MRLCESRLPDRQPPNLSNDATIRTLLIETE